MKKIYNLTAALVVLLGFSTVGIAITVVPSRLWPTVGVVFTTLLAISTLIDAAKAPTRAVLVLGLVTSATMLVAMHAASDQVAAVAFSAAVACHMVRTLASRTPRAKAIRAYMRMTGGDKVRI